MVRTVTRTRVIDDDPLDVLRRSRCDDNKLKSLARWFARLS